VDPFILEVLGCERVSILLKVSTKNKASIFCHKQCELTSSSMLRDGHGHQSLSGNPDLGQQELMEDAVTAQHCMRRVLKERQIQNKYCAQKHDNSSVSA
jgi:hypothetical protein